MSKIDENVIQNWIIEENIFKQKVSDEEANFHYIIEFPQGNIMDLIQPKGKDDFLIIVCGTQVSPEHIALIKDATMQEREDYLFDLKLELNRLDPDFQLDVDNEYILNQFVLQDILYEDELTKSKLMRTIKKIFKSKMACIFLMERSFGLPAAQGVLGTPADDNVMFM